MKKAVLDQLRTIPEYRRLTDADLEMLATVATTRLYEKGDRIFEEGDAADRFHMVLRGRVKVLRATPAGKDLILALLGPGDPVGAVAVYRGVPFPAAAEALEDTVIAEIPAQSFFGVLDESPTFVRGLLAGMTGRLMELNGRLAMLTGTRVEPRFARLFLRLADSMGRATEEGVLVAMPLSRQELADLTGTTIETCIRIMSRWGKEATVLTRPDGFVIPDRSALDRIAEQS